MEEAQVGAYGEEKVAAELRDSYSQCTKIMIWSSVCLPISHHELRMLCHRDAIQYT